MKMKKIFAAMAATAVVTSAFAAMGISTYAVERNVAFTDSADSKGGGDDGVSVRKNIYNVWTSPSFAGIDNTGVFSDYITVNFTISGIGEDTQRVDDDETATDLVAWLGGSIAGQDRHQGQFNAGDFADDVIKLDHGDGSYSVTWTLENPSETVECLYLQTNINAYAYGGGPSETSVEITIDSIITDDGEEAVVTTAATTKADDKKATTTKKADAKTTTTKAANGGKSEESTKTGDAGVGVALGVIGLAAATAFVVRKKD